MTNHTPGSQPDYTGHDPSTDQTDDFLTNSEESDSTTQYPGSGTTDLTTPDGAYALDDTGPTPDTAALTDADRDVATAQSGGTAGAGSSFASEPRTSSAGSSGLGAVKDEALADAAEVKDLAIERGGEVTATARDELGRVAGDARGQLEDLWGQAREQVLGQASSGQQLVAERLHSLAGELGEMASRSDQDGPLTSLAKLGAARGGELSHWLAETEPADVLAELRRFARRRPFVFLAGAVVAGVVVGRLSRSLAAGPGGAGRRLQGGPAGLASASGTSRSDVSVPAVSAGEQGAGLRAAPQSGAVPAAPDVDGRLTDEWDGEGSRTPPLPPEDSPTRGNEVWPMGGTPGGAQR